MENNELLTYDPKIKIVSFYNGKKLGLSYYLPNGIRVRRPMDGNKAKITLLCNQKRNLLVKGIFDEFDRERLSENFKKITIEEAIEIYKRQTFLFKTGKTQANETYILPAIFRFFTDIEKCSLFEDISLDQVENYKYYLLEKRKPKVTINNYLKVIKKVFNRLYRFKKIRVNIAQEIEFLPVTKSEIARNVVFELEHIRKLLEYPVDERKMVFPIKALFIFMLNTGIRKGEALHLSWKDIDFEKREMRLHYKADCPTIFGMGWKPKWGMERVVYLNEDALEVLKKQKRIDDCIARIKGDDKIYHYPFVFPKLQGRKINCRKKCSNCETNLLKKRDRFNCEHYSFIYSRCDTVAKSWRTFQNMAGLSEFGYKLEDTRTTFNTYAKSLANFSDELACFALGNTFDVNLKHYSNRNVIDIARQREIKSKINDLPFTSRKIGSSG